MESTVQWCNLAGCVISHNRVLCQFFNDFCTRLTLCTSRFHRTPLCSALYIYTLYYTYIMYIIDVYGVILFCGKQLLKIEKKIRHFLKMRTFRLQQSDAEGGNSLQSILFIVSYMFNVKHERGSNYERLANLFFFFSFKLLFNRPLSGKLQ